MDYKSTIERQKQGILTILQPPTSPPPPSLRRTLSADMSSAHWLAAVNFKKTASSHAFSAAGSSYSSSSSSSDTDEDEQENDHVKLGTEKGGTGAQFSDGGWNSILLQKSPKSAAVPYVHPLHKNSAAFLTQKGLLVCTESLGSETGSDGFSSDPPSEDEATFVCAPVKLGRKKSPPRSFPPPLPLLCSPDGGSVCIQSRRENGRLVLDAVSVPSQKNFIADRRDGRLVLSFVTAPVEEEDELEQLLARDFETEELRTEELEAPSPRLSSSAMSFHRLALIMKNKPNGLVNRNPPTWPAEEDKSEQITPLAQSLPPRPPSSLATAATSLNAYEYYWRSKPTGKSAGIQTPIGQQQPQPIKTRKFISSNNQIADEKQQVLVLRGNRGDYLVPLSNGCKLPRRSLLLRDPCCIATT